MCGRATVINPDGISEKLYGYTRPRNDSPESLELTIPSEPEDIELLLDL